MLLRGVCVDDGDVAVLRADEPVEFQYAEFQDDSWDRIFSGIGLCQHGEQSVSGDMAIFRVAFSYGFQYGSGGVV